MANPANAARNAWIRQVTGFAGAFGGGRFQAWKANNPTFASSNFASAFDAIATLKAQRAAVMPPVIPAPVAQPVVNIPLAVPAPIAKPVNTPLASPAPTAKPVNTPIVSPVQDKTKTVLIVLAVLGAAYLLKSKAK